MIAPTLKGALNLCALTMAAPARNQEAIHDSRYDSHALPAPLSEPCLYALKWLTNKDTLYTRARRCFGVSNILYRLCMGYELFGSWFRLSWQFDIELLGYYGHVVKRHI